MLKKLRHVVYALIPVVLLLAFLEGVSAWLMANPRRFWGVFDAEHFPVPMVYERLAFDDPAPTVADAYSGYRFADPVDPASRRPPFLPPPPKADREVRILCLGDSTTYNLAANESESWPGRLRKRLDRWATDGVRFEVYNGAVPGYGPQQCKRLLQSRYLALEPDIVLWREEARFADCLDLADVLPDQLVEAKHLLLRSRFIYLATNLRILLSEDSRNRSAGLGWYSALYNTPGSHCPDERENVLVPFSQWLRDRGVATVIGVEYLYFVPEPIPETRLMYYRPTDGTWPLYGNAVQWKLLGLPYVPGADAFASSPPDRIPFIDNCHFTPAGMQLQADLVADYLMANWDQIAIDVSVRTGTETAPR